MSEAIHVEERESRQFSTFFIGDRMYGIDVKTVQEITKSMPMTRVPLSPGYVHGLINLRGQLATAIGLRDLFATDDAGSCMIHCFPGKR